MKLIHIAAWLSLAISTSPFAQPISLTQFMSGDRATYTSADNPKAKGVELSFDYPVSWEGQAGKRPNVVQLVTSENGRGLESCLLLIKDIPMPVGHTVTPQDVAELFETSELKDYTPSGSQFITGAKTTIDGQPVAWIHSVHEIDRAGIQIRMMSITYPVYFDKKLITFSCSISGRATTPMEAFEARYKEYLPLFQLIASSIVIHTKWKRRP